VDAVYAMAHAIHDMIADVCGTNPFRLCDKLRPAPPGVDLLTYIRNVSFTGEIF
jgi:Receptor family ligand binding region